MSRDEATVYDMLLACRDIGSFTHGVNEQDFKADRLLQSAVLYQIAVIGEAVSRLSEGFKQEHASIDWRNIRKMRNVLVHDYSGVDLTRVYAAVEREVPRLRMHIESLFDDF